MAVQFTGVGAGSDPWKILPDEWIKFEEQFCQLNPIQGIVTGDQAKKFFLQSQLPPQVLGQIWSLADTNSDGKMDKNEFAIAMKLVKMKLKGFEVPKTLPDSLKAVAKSVMGTYLPLGSCAMPPMGMSGLHSVPTNVIGIPPTITPPPPPVAAFPPSSQFGAGPVVNGAAFVIQPPATTVSSIPPVPPVGTAGVVPIRSSSPLQRSSSVTSQDSPTGSLSSPLQEWALPQLSKLKYAQLFNTNDRMRTGFLSGPQARNVLVQTGLSQSILAQIWALSDLDGDGRLSCEEFCLALHLADCVKAGDKLPVTLPSDLIPPSFRKKLSPSLTSGVSSSGSPVVATATVISSSPSNLISDLLSESKEEELKKALMTTFEDKRRENFEKGQAELERRRQALLESQRKEREERERKEKEEQERKERIRQDQERRRQMELEKQLAKQREIEQEKEEQRRKAMEQREAARREMERQRQLEWEKQRRQELLSQRQKEQEKVLQLKAQNQNLGIELEQLNEKVKDLNQRIIDTRSGVADIKNSIDQMRMTRDSKLYELDLLKKQVKEQNLKLTSLNQERIALDDLVKVNNVTNTTGNAFSLASHSFTTKHITVKNLKDKYNDIEKDVEQKLCDIDANNSQLRDVKEQVQSLLIGAEKLFQTYDEKRSVVLKMRQERGITAPVTEKVATSSSNFDSTWDKNWIKEGTTNEWPEDGFKAEWGETNSWPLTTDNWNIGAEDTNVKYRALYSFEARNPDELTIMPGDIIMVFPNQTSEPGWLSGELKGKTGWFPESYVERMDSTVVATGATIESVPENGNSSGTSSLTGVQETVHIVGTEMKMTLSGIQEAPESISDNGSLGAEMISSEQPVSAFIQVPKSGTPGSASPIPGQGQTVEGLQAQALFPWRAKKENHLTFNKNDIITIKEQQDIWWFGELEGRQGWFPKSYVKLISGPKKGGSSFPITEDYMQDSGGVKNLPVDSEHKYYIATYAYQSSEPGDLTFERGDLILVTKMDGDWWSGSIDNRFGIFPCNYVKMVEEIEKEEPIFPEEPPPETKSGKKPEIATVIAPYVATGPEQLSLQRGQLLSVRKKNSSGWWEGELHAKGKKRQIGWFPASYVKLLSTGDSSARSTPELTVSKESGEQTPVSKTSHGKVVALYPYIAQNEDELTFDKGAVIHVINKEDDAWWKGECGGMVGVFPSNYVAVSDGTSIAETEELSPMEKKRQGHIQEMITTEETYVADMSIVLDAFYTPLNESGILTNEELDTIFVNWNELLICNTTLMKAFRVRKKMSDNVVIQKIGDILCEHLPHMTPYVRFCSCQLSACAIIQLKTETSQEFRDLTKQCSQDPRTKGMPVSSFLLKPMQRITKYPLLIKKVLEHTPETHPDYHYLADALTLSEELCSQVNEGVREKENSDRLEFVQKAVNCDGAPEKIIFNSLTNCLGPRKFLHNGTLHKSKSNKELMAYLFNDFLLLTQPYKNTNSVGSMFALDKLSYYQYKMYRKPIFLNEIDIKTAEGNSEDSVYFQVYIHNGHTYYFRTPSSKERNIWVRKLKSAAAHYCETEKNKMLKKQPSHVQQRPALGRLLVVVLEGVNLRAKADGRSDPYCEVNMGSQAQRTKVVNDTINPKWNSSMQFIIKDLEQDVLCITVFDRDYFSPNDFLGRTEIRISDVLRKRKAVGPTIFRQKLLEVDTGEITVKLDVQLFA